MSKTKTETEKSVTRAGDTWYHVYTSRNNLAYPYDTLIMPKDIVEVEIRETKIVSKTIYVGGGVKPEDTYILTELDGSGEPISFRRTKDAFEKHYSTTPEGAVELYIQAEQEKLYRYKIECARLISEYENSLKATIDLVRHCRKEIRSLK